MEIGNYVRTPRFLEVKIKEVFESPEEARKNGFIEPTHYEDKQYDVLGKSIGLNRMIFAGVKKSVVYQVMIKREGTNHFVPVGDYKEFETAQEILDYYREQSWVSEAKIEEKRCNSVIR